MSELKMQQISCDAPDTPQQSDRRKSSFQESASPPLDSRASTSGIETPTKHNASSRKSIPAWSSWSSADEKWAAMRANEARMKELNSSLGHAKRASDEHQKRIEELNASMISARFDAALTSAKLREMGKKLSTETQQKQDEHWEKVKSDVAGALSEKRTLASLRRDLESKEAEAEALRQRINEDEARGRAASRGIQCITALQVSGASSASEATEERAESNDLMGEVKRMVMDLEERERQHSTEKEKLVQKIEQARNRLAAEVPASEVTSSGWRREAGEEKRQASSVLVDGCSCRKCIQILKERADALEAELHVSKVVHQREVDSIIEEAAGELSRSIMSSLAFPHEPLPQHMTAHPSPDSSSSSSAAEAAAVVSNSPSPHQPSEPLTSLASEGGRIHPGVNLMTSFALSDRIMTSLKLRAMEMNQESTLMPQALTSPAPASSYTFRSPSHDKAFGKKQGNYYSFTIRGSSSASSEYQGASSSEVVAVKPLDSNQEVHHQVATLDTMDSFLYLST